MVTKLILLNILRNNKKKFSQICCSGIGLFYESRGRKHSLCLIVEIGILPQDRWDQICRYIQRPSNIVLFVFGQKLYSLAIAVLVASLWGGFGVCGPHALISSLRNSPEILEIPTKSPPVLSLLVNLVGGPLNLNKRWGFSSCSISQPWFFLQFFGILKFWGFTFSDSYQFIFDKFLFFFPGVI